MTDYLDQRPMYRYRPNSQQPSLESSPYLTSTVLASQVPQNLVLRSSSVPSAPQYLQSFDHSRPASIEPEGDFTMPNFHAPAGPQWKLQYDGAIYPSQYRAASPCLSAWSSSYGGSTSNDRNRTPWSSPEMSVDYSPRMVPQNVAAPGLIDNINYGSSVAPLHGSGVAMHDIQQYADMPLERMYDCIPDTMYSYSWAQEGYQPVQAMGTPASEPIAIQTVEQLHGHNDCEQPVIKRRRVHAHRSATSPDLRSKVTKRASGSYHKRSSLSNARSASDNVASQLEAAAGGRAFLCPLAPYGCPATFGSKNEWKRHVNTQHLRLGFWRCDQCPSHDRKPNDFNRKDLFVQHVRRMHSIEVSSPPKDTKNSRTKAGRNDAVDIELARASQRCFKRLRNAPDCSSCIFCEAKFSGEGSWDERMEHVGRHMESMKREGNEHAAQLSHWQMDDMFEDYLAAEGLIVPYGDGYVLAERRP